MNRLVRRGLLFIVFLLALLLVLGVTTVLADGYHTVRAGETLYSIGRLYGVNPYTIASVNGLANPDYIRIGQVLYIPASTGWTAPPPAPRWWGPYWPYYYPWYYYPYCWWYGYWRDP